MKTDISIIRIGRVAAALGFALVAMAAMVFSSSAVRADDAILLTPPLIGADIATAFTWNELPQGRHIPIVRACFDEGGYRLYDSAGEVIVAPFTDDNLYVMQFARCNDGGMYFVNDGTCPVLYLPPGGCLENATVAGACWYPFSSAFCPTTPVYLGIAPSWDAFIGMGWYPRMCCYGGYWCGAPFGSGLFVATPGFAIWIGSSIYHGWSGYTNYCRVHPSYFHIGFYGGDAYHWGSQPSLARPPFRGFRGAGVNGIGAHTSRVFLGAQGGHGAGFGGFSGSGHVFHGATGAGHEFHGAGGFGESGGARSFRGGEHSFGEEGSFGGSRSFEGGNHSFGGAAHSFGNSRSFGGGRSIGGGSHSSSGRDSGGHGSFRGAESDHGRGH